MFKKIFKAVLFFAAVVTSGLAVAAPVGYVHGVKGAVTLRDAGKQPAQVKVGDTFEQGANFTTGADGQVTLKFEDGQVAMLSPNTVFVATTYVYNKAKVADGNIVFNLLRGGLRFVSGVMAETNPAKFAIRTPTATAGVRGSGAVINVSQDGQTTTAVTTKGVITLSVTNAAGQVTTVVIALGQFSSAAPGVPPTPAQSATLMASTPGLAGVAQLVQALSVLPAPPNNPVAVQAVATAIQLAVAAAADPTNTALQAQAAAALQTAVTENQAAITAAIAGGAAAGAGSDTGGAAPPVTTIDTTVVPAPANKPATTTSTG